jgi:hypothetical protein
MKMAQQHGTLSRAGPPSADALAGHANKCRQRTAGREDDRAFLTHRLLVRAAQTNSGTSRAKVQSPRRGWPAAFTGGLARRPIYYMAPDTCRSCHRCRRSWGRAWAHRTVCGGHQASLHHLMRQGCTLNECGKGVRQRTNEAAPPFSMKPSVFPRRYRVTKS